MLWILLAVVLMGAPAGAQELELVSIEEEVNSLGWVTFSGRVRNPGPQVVRFPRAVITLKKEGRVVEIHSGSIDTPSEDTFRPGEEGTFEVATATEKSAYDEYLVRLQSRAEGLDPRTITGDLDLLENSISVSEFLGDAQILGEFVNGTNAVISEVKLRFALYDAEGNFLGTAEVFSFYLPQEIRPGEVISFEAFSEVDFEKVARWEASWEFVGVRLAEEIPTAVEKASWGEVKGVFGR